MSSTSDDNSVDSYLTIAQDSEIEIKVKASRFVARAFHTDSRLVAEEKLNELRKVEFDATHHCFGYLIRADEADGTTEISSDRNIFRYSDDGEPSGSAGKPIYDQIRGRKLVDTLVVVTRYYGGTKLGTGGLVRAYSEAASLALVEAGQLRKFYYQSFTLETDFSHYQQALNLLESLDAQVDDSKFTENVQLIVRIRVSCVDRFSSEFTELTHGKGILVQQE